jgi:hypothetical protein
MLMFRHDEDEDTIFNYQVHFDQLYNFHNIRLVTLHHILFFLNYRIELFDFKFLFFNGNNC